LVNPATD